MKSIGRAIFVILLGAVTFWSYAVPDAKAGPDGVFQRPALARIFFFHFPCPMMATFLLLLGAWFALRYLRSDDLRWDVRSEAAFELGYIYCLLTMATGILFSQVQWGAWWHGDPRQTSFLMVLFIYAAYFALRGALGDEHKKASYAGAYGLAALLPALFLVYVFPRLPQIEKDTLHPNNSILGGQIAGPYGQVTIAVLVLVVILSVWLYRLRVRAGLLELEAIKNNGKLESDRGAAAPTGVVRPVSLPAEGGEAGSSR